MKKIIAVITILFLFNTFQTVGQTTKGLRQKIQQIVLTKNAIVGVSIIGNNGKDTLSINGDSHFALQSVFKFHIALVVLSKIDLGYFSLTQLIKIDKKDLSSNLYSPIRDKYPNGVTLSISKILEYMVSESDNVGCDVLLRLIGGPQVVDDYFVKNNFKDLSIKLNEEVQQSNWDLQFQNWSTPKAANDLLSKFYYSKGKLLSQNSYDFIWKIMKDTKTGKSRLKGQLSKDIIVAHKTGTSGTNKDGLTAAVNDIGIVFMPNGQHYFISVFIANSKEDETTNEKIIASISKATLDYFTTKAK